MAGLSNGVVTFTQDPYHHPWITMTYSYNINTGACSVTWNTDSTGWFCYYFFRFYIMMRKRVDGQWVQRNTIIGGMAGNGNNIWYPGSASTTIAKGDYTQVGFGVYCSAIVDGGRCDDGWGGGITLVSDWYNMGSESVKPSLSLASRWTDPITGNVDTNQSSSTGSFTVNWSTSGAAPKKLAIAAYAPGSSTPIYMDSYGTGSVSNPVILDGNTKSGSYTFNLGGDEKEAKWWTVSCAISTEELGETIANQWNTDYTSISIRTRDAGPRVEFTKPTCTGTSCTFSYTSRLTTDSSMPQPLHSLQWQLTDKTTGEIRTGYIFNNVSAADAGYYTHTGSCTIDNITPGHDYFIRPLSAYTSYSHAPMVTWIGWDFSSSIPPTIEAVGNTTSYSGNLILGEPDGNPAICVKIKGTYVYTCIIKIGTSISGGIVQSPCVTYTSNPTSSGDSRDVVIYLSDSQIDALYKTFEKESYRTIYVSIEYYISYAGNGSGSHYVSKTLTLNGNIKTAKAGVAGAPRRSKVWVGVAGKARRALCWAGVANKPRRTL